MTVGSRQSPPLAPSGTLAGALLPLVLTAFSLSVPFVSQHKDTCGAAALSGGGAA